MKKNDLAISYVCAQPWHPAEKLFMSAVGVFIGFMLGMLICLIFNVPEADWRPVWWAMATVGSIPWTVMPLIGNTYYAKGLNKIEREVLDKYLALSVESRKQFPDFEHLFNQMVKDKQLWEWRARDRYPYGKAETFSMAGQKIYDALGKVRDAEKKRAAQIASQEAQERLQAIESDLNAFVERAEAEAEIVGTV